MALAVPRRHGDDGLAVAYAGLLVRLGDSVDVGSEGDHRAPRAPPRRPGAGHAGDAQLDLEAVVLEDARQIPLRLEFLHAQLAEREKHVDDLLNHLGPRPNQLEGFSLEGLQPRVHLLGRKLGSEEKS